MNAKIPLFTLATTLTVGCSVEPVEQGKEIETETAAGNEDNEEENTEENQEETEEETEAFTINGSWSLSSSEESCHESYYTFCGQFTEFTMEIEDEEAFSSNIVFTSVYENETYIETLIMESFSEEGDGAYSISLTYGNISFGLDCLLADEDLECSGSRPDYELELQVILTK